MPVTSEVTAMRNVALAAAAASEAVVDNSGSAGACGGGGSKLVATRRLGVIINFFPIGACLQ